MMGSMARLKTFVLLTLAFTLESLANPISTSSPVVDLGYPKYEGYYNSTSDLNVYKGIRYAAAPIGKLRWQAPHPPTVNRDSVLSATKQPPLCPQSGGAKLPNEYGFISKLGDEDCLFLNIFAPPGAKDLPVLLWIHGGGYGLFGAYYDPSDLINTNQNGFIVVEIQYRLGAFGFLASEDVHQFGKTNAGLLDMRFALEWVKDHISKFGGDSTRVTLGGESAGAGAVMLQAMAYGGREDHLFNNIIAASPYSGPQYHYNDDAPMDHYRDFARRAGCHVDDDRVSSAVFDCLVDADTEVLQYASANVSISGAWGTWAFLPVTDGDFLRTLPSKQLHDKKVSGKRMLSANNANDGVPLGPIGINTNRDFSAYIDETFPHVDRAGLARLYNVQSTSPESHGALYDTLGDSGPTALNQSEFANGLQQTALDIFAESSFECPSYWLADAFSGDGRESWKYQYSVTPGVHGDDLKAYFSVGESLPTRGFRHALQKIWGNFIVHNTPVISIKDAKGGADNSTVPEGADGHIMWPKWDQASPELMNLNTTGGTLLRHTVTKDLAFWLRLDPGVTNEFKLANATSWEGGRGERCDFWRRNGPQVPL
ncbi:CAZyme family CE10 [Penicillium capsulatum]|uniref:Carboxylic ester hydrolase n=1 Tax=Penicillium capsulatum TaxID=69766 RepID=A0A9W9IKS3_9EURO|nr:CAZyme family CE10 [Penicillium capsulatum]KAJ6122257.1 CAZyme family CE10 [Penicillium capsulatum]